MSTALVKGQNGPLDVNDVVISVEIAAPADLSALLVTENGKVRSDADFVFFNQPSGPGVHLQPSPGQPAALVVSLPGVPADIAQIRAVITLDDPGNNFGRIPAPTARIADGSGNVLFEYRVEGLSSESIVIALELYRRQGSWKVRAVGQGYAGGFAALVTDHGVSVNESPQPAAQQPAPPQPAAPAGGYPPPPGGQGAYPPPNQPGGQGYPPAGGPGYPPPAPGYGQPGPGDQYAPTGGYPPPPTGQYGPGGGYPPPNQPGGQGYPPPPGGQYPPQAGYPPAGGPGYGQPAPAGDRDLPAGGQTVSLVKGQRVNLRKEGGGSLTYVKMGLGWDPVKRGGMFGNRAVDIDLDASVALFADMSPVDVVYYGALSSKDGSVRHQGDNLTGEGAGDDEVILVDLTRVPSHVTTLLFMVTSYKGHTFQQVANAFCRLVDGTSNAELARYTLDGGTPTTAMAMAKLSRDGAGGVWKMEAIGEGFQAKHPGEALPQLGRFVS
ncbi:TerD family protein [Nocardia huaxiensis]|uniref:TerD family protein n=1 Tax=Nocardia huaxiensis TaxID=2755382 RepID=A0A7D6ZAJ0_9NOCA|nr:TerD family protein [Nocardia huaxiensis]QLY30948.1 TerD family protein [Nocardia huaxiensis]UFS94464.1 TerD family protein [Nocardia huaxiensis]